MKFLQWLAVEMEDMAIRRRIGATSVQYKKLAPRKPMGTKVLYSTTTESIDCEESNERGEELPCQSTTSESLGCLGVETKVLLEENVGVDTDKVGTAHLLVELEEDTQSEAVEELVGVFDASDLGKDFGGVDGEATEGSDGMTGLFGSVLEDEPSGALGEAVDGGHEDEGEEDGDGDRGSPSDRAMLELEEAKVDPRLENVSKADEETSENNLSTTIHGGRCLTLPDRNNGTQLTDTQTDDDTTDDELRKAK
ncbi:hypothetical protein HG531_011169 [Fusarium graminearum]|nr:hypothetical protein HG531_011169 [Fusarium graminearum]